MAKNYHQDGRYIDVVAPSGGLISGNFYISSDLFGVVQNTVLEGETTTIDTAAVYLLPKTTGAAWVQGDPLYWDVATSKFTKTAGENQRVAIAAYAAASGDATGYVAFGKAVPLNGPGTQQAAVPDLTENTGAIGGSSDGNLPDLTATAATLTGTLTGTANGSLVDVAATAAATAGGSSPTAAQVDAGIATAVASIVTGTNEQHKELMTMLNAVIADNVALRAAARENATKINATLAKLRLAGIIEDA